MSCKSCGGCGGCSGCGEGGVLLLSPIEYDILLCFGEIPFYPAAFSGRGSLPQCPDLAHLGEDVGQALRALEQKRILSVDEEIPLQGCDYGFAPEHHLRGSLALTAYGQQVIDTLYLNGLS